MFFGHYGNGHFQSTVFGDFPKNTQNANEAILRRFDSGNHYDDRGGPPKL